ncbi:TPA: TonB-dependent receptor, partial [Mannheimia haemolytica]|nr:TonB-dependent receptor [Mannheimia haemolytica]
VTHGANVNFDSALHENVLLKYGVNYRHQETKPYAKFSHQLVNQEKTDTGVYLEAITAPVDKVTLTTGVRYDHFKFKAMDGKKRSEGAFNPSVGIIYEPIQHLSFSASHNYATRSPRMHDALLSHGRRGVVSIANNTKAEQARSTEIGFNYNDGTFSFDGSYFWQNIKDALGTSTGRNNHLCPELTPNTNNKECYSEIINAGTIKNRGYELNAGYHNNGFTARVGVAHSKPRFQGDRLSTNPEYASAIGRTWTASLSYRFDQPNLEVGVHHRIIEKVKAEDNYFVMNNNGIPQFGRGGPTGKDGYNVTDITLNWKPLNDDSVNVNFAVDNVANKKYNAHGQRGQLSARGREFRAGVNYTF